MTKKNNKTPDSKIPDSNISDNNIPDSNTPDDNNDLELIQVRYPDLMDRLDNIMKHEHYSLLQAHFETRKIEPSVIQDAFDSLREKYHANELNLETIESTDSFIGIVEKFLQEQTSVLNASREEVTEEVMQTLDSVDEENNPEVEPESEPVTPEVITPEKEVEPESEPVTPEVITPEKEVEPESEAITPEVIIPKKEVKPEPEPQIIDITALNPQVPRTEDRIQHNVAPEKEVDQLIAEKNPDTAEAPTETQEEKLSRKSREIALKLRAALVGKLSEQVDSEDELKSTQEDIITYLEETYLPELRGIISTEITDDQLTIIKRHNSINSALDRRLGSEELIGKPASEREARVRELYNNAVDAVQELKQELQITTSNNPTQVDDSQNQAEDTSPEIVTASDDQTPNSSEVVEEGDGAITGHSLFTLLNEYAAKKDEAKLTEINRQLDILIDRQNKIKASLYNLKYQSDKSLSPELIDQINSLFQEGYNINTSLSADAITERVDKRMAILKQSVDSFNQQAESYPARISKAISNAWQSFKELFKRNKKEDNLLLEDEQSAEITESDTDETPDTPGQPEATNIPVPQPESNEARQEPLGLTLLNSKKLFQPYLVEESDHLPRLTPNDYYSQYPFSEEDHQEIIRFLRDASDETHIVYLQNLQGPLAQIINHHRSKSRSSSGLAKEQQKYLLGVFSEYSDAIRSNLNIPEDSTMKIKSWKIKPAALATALIAAFTLSSDGQYTHTNQEDNTIARVAPNNTNTNNQSQTKKKEIDKPKDKEVKKSEKLLFQDYYNNDIWTKAQVVNSHLLNEKGQPILGFKFVSNEGQNRKNYKLKTSISSDLYGKPLKPQDYIDLGFLNEDKTPKIPRGYYYDDEKQTLLKLTPQILKDKKVWTEDEAKVSGLLNPKTKLPKPGYKFSDPKNANNWKVDKVSQ